MYIVKIICFRAFKFNAANIFNLHRLKYCRHGVKPYTINQSINQSINQMLLLFPTNESCPYFQRTLLHHITHYYCTYTCTSQKYKSQDHRYRISLTGFSNIHHKILKYITRYLNISQNIEHTSQDLEYTLQDLRSNEAQRFVSH